ncbi:MAG: phosphosulfolactate synthase [Bacteroidia bacterium]|nr:phosphosulfolactate synthase [Bacteroidia bacterium]
MTESILDPLPQRDVKPREKGLTMVMDKGLSLRQAEGLCEVAGHLIDFIKLGFGTSMVSKGVEEKVKIYQRHGIKVYVGGTLLEAFLIRGQMENYKKFIGRLGCDAVEVSDGSITIRHEKKCELIREFSKTYYVLSEVGSKEEGVIIHPNRWLNMMKEELSAGSKKVIAEARESGTVGIYHKDGSAHTILINRITSSVNVDNILWEAPQKNQQVFFIKLFGSNVNLGNISPDEVIPLETLRLGLRGDTFFSFLPQVKKETIL